MAPYSITPEMHFREVQQKSLFDSSFDASFAQITVALNFSTLLTLRTILSNATRFSKTNLYIGNFPFPTVVRCKFVVIVKSNFVEAYKWKRLNYELKRPEKITL